MLVFVCLLLLLFLKLQLQTGHRRRVGPQTTDHRPLRPQTADLGPQTPCDQSRSTPQTPQTTDRRPETPRDQSRSVDVQDTGLGPWTLDRGHARRRALSGVNFDATRRCAKHQPCCITKLSYRTRPKDICGCTKFVVGASTNNKVRAVRSLGEH